MGTDDWQLWGLQREPGPRVGTRPTGQHTHSLLWLTAPRGLKAVIPGVQWGGGAPEYLVVWEKEADLGTVTHSNFGGLQTSEWSAQMMPSILILREELRIL